jgi:hypothetical protein
MKGIHAISTILAVWGIGSTPVVSHAPPASRTRTPDAGSSSEVSMYTISSRVISERSRAGIPNLLAAALLQGGSSAGRRRY